MNYTEHIDLSQIEANDKPTWLNMYNSDMRKIDNAVGDLISTTGSVSKTIIPELVKDISDLRVSVADNSKNIAVNTTSIAALQLADKNLQADIDTLDKREQAHYDALSGNVDVDKAAIKDLQDQQIVFQANLQTTRDIAAVNSSSINKLQGRVTKLEQDNDTSKTDISNAQADIDNLKADVDTLEVTNRQQDNSIAALQTSVAQNTSDINTQGNRITALEALPDRVSTLENDTNDLRTDVDKNAGDITANMGDITALQTKTANISSGVTVPFSFGTTADNKRGYEKPDGNIEAFSTAADIAEINNLITQLNAKITALNTKTANITDGMALPFSLGIESAGGAYGYIKNGETGVTPFLTSDDVEDIVDITPIQTKVQNISGSPTISAGFTNTPGNITTSNLVITSATGNDKTLKVGKDGEGAPQDIDIPFGFGIDSSGNYGYKKVGADTVTPFLANIPFSDYYHEVSASNNTYYKYGVTIKDTLSVYIILCQNTVTNPYFTYGIKNGSIVSTGGGLTKVNIDTLDKDSNIYKIAKMFNLNCYMSGSTFSIQTWNSIIGFGTYTTSTETVAYHIPVIMFYGDDIILL